ncbi:NAD(P)-dependent oxidoreductase [Chondromyces apiculatus]|uniref:NAD-dependent epimerase/dehydratase n=1 Tax=Chondromyces apiculatus DSM 436 TaxID=1192034 RepID=A0A017TD88_9BACT|nr:SDR family oxidoreductase [Chondromyces apiculatus]EYF07263.1 NAD-dependent epimerase/dehydratase [Chondromyces apiculatus DSM 436]
MKIVIFGANGPSGKILTQLALQAGHQVSAVTRHPEAFSIRHEKLQVTRGDVLDAADVARAVDGQEVVLSLFGAQYSFKPISVYSQGMKSILAAMKASGIDRLVCVTSGGTRPEYSPEEEGFLFGRIIKPLFGRTLYEDMRRMEALVMQSDRNWTIVRPARLEDMPPDTPYRAVEGYMVPGMHKTSRTALAQFMLEQASSDRFLRKAVAVGTA